MDNWEAVGARSFGRASVSLSSWVYTSSTTNVLIPYIPEEKAASIMWWLGELRTFQSGGSTITVPHDIHLCGEGGVVKEGWRRRSIHLFSMPDLPPCHIYPYGNLHNPERLLPRYNFMLQRTRTDYDHVVNCLPYWVLRWTAGDGGALGWCFLHASLTTSGNNLQPQMEGRTCEEFKDTILTQIFWGGKTHLQSGPHVSLEVYVRTWKKVGFLFACFLLP